MILYWLLRQLSAVSLRWYYADLVVQGGERVPARGPLLLVANHPNALVDAMVVASAVRRRVLLTAKATLFERPALAALLRGVGVVPLRRAQDERSRHRKGMAPVSRNADSFRLVTASLARREAVLVFPEGISHDAPTLAPLRTGAARMALGASTDGVSGLRILAVGLVYEAKERPRSRILVRMGEPIDVDAWRTASGSTDPARLTTEIDRALRRVTLNFASDTRAARAIDLASALAAIASELPEVGQTRDLSLEADLARRIEASAENLSAAPDTVVHQVDTFIARVRAFEARLTERHVSLADLRISPLARHGIRFVLREAAVALAALPAAFVGRVAHWIPLRLARTIAIGSLGRDPSRDQPAMRTIVIGAATLLLWYVAIGVLVTRWVNVGVGMLLVVAIFLAARVDVLLRDRLRRARRRARTYLAFRADPALRQAALVEADDLLAQAVALEDLLLAIRERKDC
jgi:glycerol-3-phosphate O-acyltransferase / dihydroxyacetone phosphate acyltransferase